jgi:protein TonB
LGGPGSAEGTTGEGPFGDPNGIDGGIDVGQPATGKGPAIPDMTYRPGGEVRPARVVRRVEPRYPQVMVHARMAAVVTVSCIVGKDGSIREPTIIKSSYPPFNAAVLDALKQWTFTPGTMRGQPVDTWFELTVSFNLR